MRAAHPSRNRNEPLVFTVVEKRKKIGNNLLAKPGLYPVLGASLSTLGCEWLQGENEMYRNCGIRTLEKKH
jgi:hypothetical protein